MTKQRGQALIEFAFMIPLIALFIFGMIYGAVIFMDYLNFSNDARTIARRIAVTTETTKRQEMVESYNTPSKSKFASFYNVTRNVYFVDEDENIVTNLDDSVDVMVMVNFDRDNKDLPWVLYKTGFPPKHFAIKYTMKLEKADTAGYGE
jgi:Flp pilus assembly protein TadG